MSPEEHIVEPRHGLLVLEVVREPRQHPRHAVVRFHLRIHGMALREGPAGDEISTQERSGGKGARHIERANEGKGGGGRG